MLFRLPVSASKRETVRSLKNTPTVELFCQNIRWILRFTVIDVSQARGVITLAAYNKGLEIAEYTPLQVKQSVVGYGRAEKKQVQEMTRTILGLDKVPKPDDTADALAMAICHGHSSGSLLQNMKGRTW